MLKIFSTKLVDINRNVDIESSRHDASLEQSPSGMFIIKRLERQIHIQVFGNQRAQTGYPKSAKVTNA